MQGVSRVNTVNYSVASAVGGGAELTSDQINRLSPTRLYDHMRARVPSNLKQHIVLESTNEGQMVRFCKENFKFGSEKGGAFNLDLSNKLLALDNLYGGNPSYVKAFDISRGAPSR